MKRTRQSRRQAAREITEETVEITSEQARIIADLNAQAVSAQERLNLVMTGILAGHSVESARITRLDGTKLSFFKQ